MPFDKNPEKKLNLKEDKKMNMVRFRTAAHPAHQVLVNDLLKNLVYNDTQEKVCKVCVPSNITEHEKDFRISLSVPGFSKEEVKVSIHDNLLTVKSEKQEQPESDNVRFLRREFGVENFEKQFKLSRYVDATNISASFVNGILEILLPKKEEILEKASVEIPVQ